MIAPRIWTPPLALLGVVIFLMHASAAASDGAGAGFEMLVAGATYGAMRRGMLIDGTKPLEVPAGEAVTLIAPDGNAVTLQGPSAAAPRSSAGRAGWRRDVARRLYDALFQDLSWLPIPFLRCGTRTARTKVPDIWYVDVESSGAHCLPKGEVELTLWRPASRRGRTFTVDGAEGRFVWPAGQDTYAVKRVAADFVDGAELRFDLSDVEQDSRIRFVELADGDESIGARALAMIGADCDRQARLLLERAIPRRFRERIMARRKVHRLRCSKF